MLLAKTSWQVARGLACVPVSRIIMYSCGIVDRLELFRADTHMASAEKCYQSCISLIYVIASTCHELPLKAIYAICGSSSTYMVARRPDRSAAVPLLLIISFDLLVVGHMKMFSQGNLFDRVVGMSFRTSCVCFKQFCIIQWWCGLENCKVLTDERCSRYSGFSFELSNKNMFCGYDSCIFMYCIYLLNNKVCISSCPYFVS